MTHQQSQIFDQKKSKNLSMREHRVHKQHKIEDIGDMVDHISNIPDCILQHILSFMPTKEVVKTSILSTRWNDLWASAPNIDFDDLLFCDREDHEHHQPEATSFINFLERVLQLRGASNIKKFHLTCFGSYEESQLEKSQIHSWISDAIMHNVEELNLALFREDPSMIPWSMFDRTSLVSLKIRTNYVSELPSRIYFPCLKTLHLLFVVFPNDDHAEKLLLGCPVLEELVLSDNLMNLKKFVISSSTLKSLIIDDTPPFQPLYDYDPSSGCTIKIDAANLTYFEYTGYLLKKIVLTNVSSLVKTCIDIPPPARCAECRAVDLLKQLQYVVSLRLSNCTLRALRFADSMLVRCPVFPNLSHLVLTTKIDEYAFGAVMDFLHLCPILQSFCLSEGFKSSMRLHEYDPVWSSIPICMSNCLKRITFKKFHPNDSAICFVKCVLKYACVLERMDIRWSKTRLADLNKTIMARKELDRLGRSYTACVIKQSLNEKNHICFLFSI